ncbi:uncharacterized protein [Panulirus ornatus]|uniref:uncharacterized protein n=1 Tax=Panulirus ornatus TaxID=150431 RepID=UPI003A8BB2A1
MENTLLPVQHKVAKIAEIFASLVDTGPTVAWCDDKENCDSTSTSAVKTQPENLEAFYSRVNSFRPGLWNVLEVSPLQCARWGWQMLEKDVIQCVTCQEVVCAILPDPSDRDAYTRFLQLLKKRLIDGHKEACGWRHNPSSEELTHPPCVSTLEELRNMANSARTLAFLNSALPYIDNSVLMETLEVDEELIKGVFTCSSTDEDVKKSSVLLVLCGWSRGQGAYLRCRVCRRSVGLWSFFTRADELQNDKGTASVSDEPHQPKEKKSSQESDDEDPSSKWCKRLRAKRVNELGNEEVGNRQDEVVGSKRQKKRERSRKSDSIRVDEPLKERKEEPSLLIIGSSPSTQLKKVEKKQYFHPLEEHRYWCTWLMKIQDGSNEEDNQVEKRGYQIVIEKVRLMIGLSSRKDLCSSEKYASNVDGLRLIRTMLNDLSEEV